MTILIVEAEFFKLRKGPGLGFIKELALRSSEGFIFRAVYAAPRGIIFANWREESYEYRKLHGIPWTVGKRPFANAITDVRRAVAMFSLDREVTIFTKGQEKAMLFSALLQTRVHDLGSRVPSIRRMTVSRPPCEIHDFATVHCAITKASLWMDYLTNLYKTECK